MSRAINWEPMTATQVRKQLGLTRGQWDHLKAKCKTLFTQFDLGEDGIGTRYWSPFLIEAIQEIRASGIIRPYERKSK